MDPARFKPTPKPKRNWKVGECYHVFQRGNHRNKVFRTFEQHFHYIFRLFLLAKRYKVRVHAFCLMGNHVHFILEPRLKWGISLLMRDLQSYHSRWIHRLGGTDGHSWKHHFGAKILDRDHYRTALWYVEFNPVRARISERAEYYLFSSAAAHCESRNLVLEHRKRFVVLDLYFDRWRAEFAGTNWSEWLRDPGAASLKERVDAVLEVQGRYRESVPRGTGFPPQQPPRVPAKSQGAVRSGVRTRTALC